MNNKIDNKLTIILLFVTSILLSSCAPKSCTSAKGDYENAQREYSKLSQELTQEYGNGRLVGNDIDRVSNELYAKSKPAADRVAIAQVEYIEACKSKP